MLKTATAFIGGFSGSFLLFYLLAQALLEPSATVAQELGVIRYVMVFSAITGALVTPFVRRFV